jgi:hypothetical protein
MGLDPVSTLAVPQNLLNFGSLPPPTTSLFFPVAAAVADPCWPAPADRHP